jgi:hypothetical protein
MKKIFVVLFVVLVFSCFSQNSRSSIIGKWYYYDFEGMEITIEFTESEVLFSEVEGDDAETLDFTIENGKIMAGGFMFELQDKNTLKLMNPEDTSEFLVGYRIDGNVRFLKGKYNCMNDTGLFKSLEFIDNRHVKIESASIGDYNTNLAGDYQISESNLILTINGDSLILKIIGENIIKGNTGLGRRESIFIKE